MQLSAPAEKSSEREERELLALWTGAFVEELASQGVREACLSPGSRSTPLALAFASHPLIRTRIHLDERCSAYFALGLAKASPERPVVLLSTSGTAAANFAPAVIEASLSFTPLIVLTADRPQELREVGANQTIEQNRLYGSHARWFLEMPLPENSLQSIRYARMAARRAVETALSRRRPGPVHLNCPFREPLLPAPFSFQKEAAPKKRLSEPVSRLPDELAERLSRAKRPLLLCGEGSYGMLEEIRLLADRGVPLLADPLSNCRSWVESSSLLAHYDAFLRCEEAASSLAPDLILRLGAPPTSKAVAAFLRRHEQADQLVVTPFDNWPDPGLTASHMLRGVYRLADKLTAPEEGWLNSWLRLEAVTRQTVSSLLEEGEAMTEPGAVYELAKELPQGGALFVGNSMPIRDLDSFWPAQTKRQLFFGNRGASGIDGCLSTALGASSSLKSPFAALLGDLAFYHDMNGLLAAKLFPLNATLILINNDGGGIFSLLPQREKEQHFETLFGTPHGLDFSAVSTLYGLDFESVSTKKAYRRALKDSLSSPGVQVIEIRSDREENAELHRLIWRRVEEALSIRW